jgi:hypothetical protein
VLIITKAGAEGVDLKNTFTIFIMDGQWNEALYEQIVARAIRYQSHMSLPKNERFVNVKKLFLCYKNEEEILNKLNKGGKFDFISFLSSVLEVRKQEKENKRKLTTLKGNDELMNKVIDFGKLEYDPEELKKFKKGSIEKKQYLEKNKAFAKSRESYLTSEIAGLAEKKPSTDFYMFVMQKVKMMIINAFIKQLDAIPSLEKSVFDLEFGKKMFKLVDQGKMDGKEMMKTLMTHLRENIDKSIKFITTTNDNKEDKLEKFLKTKHSIAQLQKQKQQLKVGQEFFTPPEQAEKLIKMSNIIVEYSKIHDKGTLSILEPTAGQGGLVNALLKLVRKKDFMMKIDMVEIAQDNREVLTKITDAIPDIVSLDKTRDFLELVPNKQYHYIFMNPPFHLDKRLNKKYKKDYYDYDFVQRAYAMLEVNGVLVAITGQSYKKNKTIVDWYDKVNAKIQDDTVKWTGDNLKTGAEIQNLSLSYIYIRKLDEDKDENNRLLKIDDFNTEVQTLAPWERRR